ncbi:MAG: prolyl oligopeptidase family serine peptidase [FCB group bacterium]|nr:prolyl oligopeptidase family serine peptidase [FCB group bacterium]MBL7024523.1 prolyl oligopeptidase family serine peptidase [Candidatus Neomarinimicrobiota bacterium]
MKNALLLNLVITSGLLATIINVPADSPSIQSGIDNATDGDTVLVAPGEYLENINFDGKAVFLSSHFALDQDTSHISGTIIDGSSANASVVTITSRTDTAAVLNGFTITGGSGNYVSSWAGLAGAGPPVLGGGVFVLGGAKITNNHIIDNHILRSSEIDGAGIFIHSGSSATWDIGTVVVNNNLIANNSLVGESLLFGAGVSLSGEGSIRISNNLISHNSVIGHSTVVGGGISIFVTRNVVLSGNTINSNTVNAVNDIDRISGGGGIFIFANSPILYNNLITENAAPHGGGIAAWGNHVGFNFRLINSTIANNHASRKGGGLFLTNGHCTAVNNIVWGNTALTDLGIYIRGNLNISYSITQETFPGDGNLQTDPLFENEIFHLSSASPAIDAGNPGPGYNDCFDPANPTQPLWPAMGTLNADMGAYGGNDTVQVDIEDYLILENFQYEVHGDMHYRFALPLDFDSDSLYPLSVVLHGSGQWGSDNEWQLYEGLPWRANAEHYGYNEFTIVPQAPTQDWGENNIATVHEIIRSVIDEYPVDTTRIVVTGWSMGGGGTWRMLNHTPDLFAAAVTVSTVSGYQSGTKHVPAWMFHGSEDSGVSYSLGRIAFYESTGLTTVYAEDSTNTQLLDAINNNARVIYSEFAGADHIIVKHAYDNYFLFEWLKKQSRRLVYPTESYVSYINEDSLHFISTIINPHEFSFEHTVRVENWGFDHIDDFMLYDDGQHGDSLAQDGIWGNYVEMPAPIDKYRIGIEIRNMETEQDFNFQDLVHFTNIGPLSFESTEQLHPANGAIPANSSIYFNLSVQNLGSTTAEDITVEIEDADTNAVINGGYSTSMVEEIPPGGVGQTLSYLGVRTAADIMDGTPIYFNVLIKSGGVPFWEDTGVLLGYVGIDENDQQIPIAYDLKQNFPNPFNPVTTISYDLPEKSEIALTIFDITGREVIILDQADKPPGGYEVQWGGVDQAANPVSTGVYFCRLQTGSYSKTIKMVYLR